MKAELTRDGYIKVTAETVTEAWALNGVWPVGVTGMDRDKNEDRVIIDCSILTADEMHKLAGSEGANATEDEIRRFHRACQEGIQYTKDALGVGKDNV